MKTECYTYFAVKGVFNPDELSDLLQLQPTRTWRVGDRRKDGSIYDFALWEYGMCREYDVDVEKQCLKTIQDLLPYAEQINAFRKSHDLSCYLELVPSVWVDETMPALGFGEEVIGFCYRSGTIIDIDLYAYCDHEGEVLDID